MKTTTRLLCGLALVAFAVLSVACGATAKVREAAERAQRSNDLKQIALAYFNYCDANNKGPTGPDDLLKGQPETSVVMQKVKAGEYTVTWGVNLNDMKQFAQNGRSGTVLAYESTVPASGGLVVMCDGAVKSMTVAEFNSAPKLKSGVTPMK